MRYVDHDLAHYLEAKGLDWKELLSATWRSTREKILVHTNSVRADRKVYAIAMMHTDGMGPSRVLLRDQLQRLFPEETAWRCPR